MIRHGANRHPRAIIDLEAIRQNYRYLKQVAGGNRLIAVLKADAYGHGAREVAAALEDADAFAVATDNAAAVTKLSARMRSRCEVIESPRQCFSGLIGH